MGEFNARAEIEAVLDVLVDGLAPLVAARFDELAPGMGEWTEVIEARDRQAGRGSARYNPRDLSLILRAFTESFGSFGYPFADSLSRRGRSLASELRDVRNRWAHNEDFSTAEAYRALDSAEMLLRDVGAEQQADEAHRRKAPVLAALAAASDIPASSSSTEPVTVAPVDSRSEPPAAASTADESDPTVSLLPQMSAAAAELEGKARIHVHSLPDLSYAQALSAIPVVSEVTVDYRGPELRAASIEIDAICALGPLGDPKVVLADLDGRAPSVLRGVDLTLDPSRMLSVENPMPGSIRVTLRDAAGVPVARHESPVAVLAGNQWRANPLQLGIELLAAFVQPNSPAIAPLLVEASDRLQQTTGSPALDGYQQGSRERVDSIVGAIYESMRARDIRYSAPPASWGLDGQKVRTPAEVLDGRIGTCLDTTVTLAAALEEAGINSTLWLLDGHIFLGYWRDDASLDGPAQMDAAEAVNYVGLGQIEVVETTFLTGGASSRPFADARRHHHTETLARDTSLILGITDIMQSRLSRIYPLPSRTVTESGEVKIVEYAVRPGPAALHYAPSEQAIAGGSLRDVPARVGQWKNALLDLSLRNRLINYGEKAGYPLAVPQPSIAAFEDMVNQGTSISLVPSDRIPTVDGTRGIRYGQELSEAMRAAQLAERKQVYVGVTEAAYATRLRALAYKARTIREETGANNLYLAFGMLRWRSGDRDLRSPLVLVPVSLEAAGAGRTFRITLDESGESTPNYCLLEKLRLSFGLDIPGLANPARDESGIDLAAAFSATRRALAAAQLPFTVDDTVDLAILQFAKYRLWKDLDDNWGELAKNPLVNHLIYTPTAEFSDPAPGPRNVDLDALNNAVPVAADSSQLEAVAEAEAGRTFVLEGPPGTGKSQTITNLLAHALAKGKRVLFVAEKRAALDVVKDRLDAVGIGPFALDLHDKGARPAAVRAQIRAAIDAIARPDEAALSANRATADSSRGALKRYAQRLHEPNTAGLSLYAARAQLLALADDAEPLEIPQALVASRAAGDFDRLRELMRTLPETADFAHPSRLHPWGFVPSSVQDSVAVHAAAREFDAALNAIPTEGETQTLLATASSPEHLEQWAVVANAPRFSVEALDAVHGRALTGEIGAIQALLESTGGARGWFSAVGPEVLLSDVHEVYRAAVAADASGFFGRRKRQRAALAGFGSALRVDPRTYPARDVTPLVAEVVGAAEEIGSLRAQLISLPLPLVSATWTPYSEEGTDSVKTSLAWAVWLGDALSGGGADFKVGLRRNYAASSPAPDLAGALTRLAAAWRGLAAAIGDIDRRDGVSGALAAWAPPGELFAVWRSTSGGRNLATSEPVTLDRWLAFLQHLEPLLGFGMSRAHNSLLTGAVPADLAYLALERGIADASIREREESQAMVSFDVAAHNRAITRFTTSAASIRAELPRAIPAEILAQRRIDPAFDGGMMGELKRQLGRQRGGMAVRTLFEHYGDLITQIAPCVLMSPESVARFFPARAAMFDIVVFDEASQIRVADAVGAMGRAGSVVVVGDSKQMPPSSFAEVSSDIESDPSSFADQVLDEESILTECVQARVSRKWLSWHYRSQDEALISFSNQAYYDSRLSSFPAPWPHAGDNARADHGISLVRVDGRFNRSGRGKDLRTNAAEAGAIVREVTRRFEMSVESTPSVGIITFNSQQRTYIEALLRESPNERIAQALDERDGLFVKNLENVQGDERDTILFSVAFSANDRGVVPLNFGPLSRAGGERRLNVAITRARRQVVLFASFDPSDLRAEETSSVGIKHLRAYLEMAASGVESSDGMSRERLVDRHRDEIAAALRSRGFAVRTDIGLSDFRVDISIADAAEPALPLVAVLLDGESWRARRTVADRDGLPVDVLKGLMGWPAVERVWLPEWMQQREETIDRLGAAVEAAKAGVEAAEPVAAEATGVATLPVSSEDDAELGIRDVADIGVGAAPEVPAPVRSAPAPTSGVASAELRHPRVRQFTPWTPSRSGSIETLDDLPDRRAVDQVRTVITKIVESEGPIHRERLARLAAESFGLSRVAPARMDAILRCLSSDHVRAADKSCAWPSGIEPDRWRDVRVSSPGDGRPLEHVPLDEIANAMAVAAELGGGMAEGELKRQALNMFGGKRVTAGIDAILTAALTRAVKTGRIARDERGVFLAQG